MKVRLACTDTVIYSSYHECDVRIIQFRLGIKEEDLDDFLAKCIRYCADTDVICFVSCGKYRFTERDIFYHLA